MMKLKPSSILLVLFLLQGSFSPLAYHILTTFIAVHPLDCPDGQGINRIGGKGGKEVCEQCNTRNCRVCRYGSCENCQENYVLGEWNNCVACPEGQYSDTKMTESYLNPKKCQSNISFG